MKALLFCFSGTGNTRWVCERFVEEGQRRGWVDTSLVVVDRHTLADLDALELSSFDLIGLGHPIYGAGLPPVVERLIDGIEGRLTEPKDAFILATFGFVNGLGWKNEQRHCQKLRIRYYINVRMPNNVTTPQVRAPIPGPAERTSRQAAVRTVVKKAWNRILLGRRWITGFGPWLVPGPLIRRAARPRIEGFHSVLSVDPERCTHCGRCVAGCPTGAIGLESGRFSFSPACTACTRCYNTCPENAILLEGTYADPKTYPRYFLG